MGSTSPDSLPYPELSAAANVPADIRALAEAVQTALNNLDLGGVQKRVMRTASNQSISNGATTTLNTWETYSANNDTGTLFSYSSGVLTCVKAGNYRVWASASLAGGGSGTWAINIKHGSTIVQRRQANQGGDFSSLSVEASLMIAVGETLEIQVTNSTGSARNCYGGTSDRALWTVQFDGDE